MTAARILEKLAAAGVSVRREGDSLRLKPSRTGIVPPDVVELARTHKAELLAMLADPLAATPAPANVLRLSSDIAEQRRRLAEAMRLQGFDSRLLHLLPDTEIEGVEWLSEPGLLRYAEILAARRGCTCAQT